MRINERGLFRRTRGLPGGLCVSSEAFAAGAKVERLSESEIAECEFLGERHIRVLAPLAFVASEFASGVAAGKRGESAAVSAGRAHVIVGACRCRIHQR